jgi:competence CoiA-like predicted nuclease
MNETYQQPIFPEKKYDYICPDPSCKGQVILRKSEKNRPHFCHKKIQIH